MIIIASVRHTGTRFLREHLFKGYEHINRHVGEDSIIDLDAYDCLVIPLRRLDRIIVSWERRGMELPWLRSVLTDLICRYDHKSPLYMPIDSSRREHYLQELAEGLNLDLKTDWPVVCSDKGSSDSSIDDIQDKEYARGMIKDFEQFFNRFYRA